MANFTRLAIKETFIKLLEERPLSEITIKDIVERCGINSEFAPASDSVNAQIAALTDILKRYDSTGMLIGEAPSSWVQRWTTPS